MQSGCTSKHRPNNKQMATSKYSQLQLELQRDPRMKWQGIKGEIQFAGHYETLTLHCANWKLTFGGTDLFTADVAHAERKAAGGQMRKAVVLKLAHISSRPSVATEDGAAREQNVKFLPCSHILFPPHIRWESVFCSLPDKSVGYQSNFSRFC